MLQLEREQATDCINRTSPPSIITACQFGGGRPGANKCINRPRSKRVHQLYLFPVAALAIVGGGGPEHTNAPTDQRVECISCASPSAAAAAAVCQNLLLAGT